MRLMFSGENYQEWEVGMGFYLKAKGLWKAVEENPMARRKGGEPGKEVEETREVWAARRTKFEDQDMKCLGLVQAEGYRHGR